MRTEEDRRGRQRDRDRFRDARPFALNQFDLDAADGRPHRESERCRRRVLRAGERAQHDQKRFRRLRGEVKPAQRFRSHVLLPQ